MNWDKGELVRLLGREDFTPIYEEADRIRRERKGDAVLIRALLEFSNHCRRVCRYCGLNAGNRNLTRFRMKPDQMLAVAQEAARAGYQTLVLQSGEDMGFSVEELGEVVKEVKRTGMAVTLSCGEYPEKVYRYWRDCGADRYLLKHETSDPALYRTLHPDSDLGERVKCLKTLKKLGYETGGGFMIGLPGQTLATIADDLLLLQEIGCDMVGIGPFIPHPDTPLRGAEAGSTELTRRAVALCRLLLPEANLPATTSLGVLNGEEKRNVFSCGANVIMKKVTPQSYKELYEIYPAAFSETSVKEGRAETEREIRSMGREPI